MKNYLGLIIVAMVALCILSACSLVTEQGTVVINFCDMTSPYIDCTSAEFTATDLSMRLETMQGVAVDSVVFELPNTDSQGNPMYCTGTITSLGGSVYGVDSVCNLSAYTEQNTQLKFVVTLSVTTPSGTTTATAEGQGEDYIETV